MIFHEIRLPADWKSSNNWNCSLMLLQIIGGTLCQLIFFCLVCCFTSQSTAKVSTPNHFFLSQLDQVVWQYFMQILLLLTDKNPSWISRREENDRRNYFMIHLRESMRSSQDRTRSPWICSQTRYLLSYAVRYWLNYPHCSLILQLHKIILNNVNKIACLKITQNVL